MAELKLSTEKYYLQARQQYLKQWKQARRRKMIRDFATFVFGLAAFGLGLFVAERFPHLLSWIRLG